MKRSIEALVVIEMVVVIVAMAIAGLCGIARAEHVQQFGFQVGTPRPGDLSVRIQLRDYDTTGVVPPTPASRWIHLPAGVHVDRAFIDPRYFCDGAALRDALDVHPSGTPFFRRLMNLKAFIRELERSQRKRDRSALANARVCERARFGIATGLIDARGALPVLVDPIPFSAALFVSRGTVPGAIVGFTAVGAANGDAPIVRRYPVVAGVHAIEQENLVDDPTPDGLYGDKLLIYTGPLNGFQLSRAEVDVTAHSLRLRRGTCLSTSRGGRCTRRQPTDASLFVIPRCSAADRFSAQLLTTYPPPAPSLSSTVELPCPGYAS